MALKDFFKKAGGKIAGVVSGVGVLATGAISAFAAEGSSEAVSAAESLLNSATGTLNIGNIVAIIGAGIGAVIGLFLAWWGARKLVRMLVSAFKKGKVSV